MKKDLCFKRNPILKSSLKRNREFPLKLVEILEVYSIEKGGEEEEEETKRQSYKTNLV